MKNLIKESGKTLKEFAEFYEIPYNTVRQWYNEERKAPQYIKKLIEKAAQGKQLEITDKIVYYCYSINEKGMTGVYQTEFEESMIKWKENMKQKKRPNWIELHYVKEIIN